MPTRRLAMTKLLTPNPRFLRSVHLERDFFAKDTANGFIATRGSRSALSLLARGSLGLPYRAQCISGPYGSGKSALALYFAKLLDNQSTNGLRVDARKLLGETAEQLLPSSDQGYLTILATGTRENLSTCLLRNLKQSLEMSGRKSLLNELPRKHKSTIESGKPSTRAVVGVFEALSELVVRRNEALGIVIVIDELGKLLEHAALNPDQNDIQLLQELAEAASRSHNYPVWFITILHQQFSQYATRLGRQHQQEWAKVQQRFFDVPCTLDSLDSLQLVASALNSSKNKSVLTNTNIIETARACSRFAPRGSENQFEQMCIDSYPIHPIVLIMLPSLFRRFGQNERSLFSFISANEPFSLANWAKTQDFNMSVPVYFRIPDLYDYTRNTLIGGAPTPEVAHAWAEVEDATVRLGDATQVEVDVLKSIGLFALIGEAAGVTASQEILGLAIRSKGHESVSHALENLLEKRLIVFRRFRNAYRLWEGSDVDINERLSDAYQALPTHSVVLSVARDLCPSPSLVARRHSFKTGMMRSFSVIPSSSEDLLTALDTKDSNDGHVVQCLVENDEQRTFAETTLENLVDPPTSVIVLIGTGNDRLSDAARDVDALAWIRANTPDLAGDRIARQELNERSLEAETAFRLEWDTIFRAESDNTKCYYLGENRDILSSKDFSCLLSEACDNTFPHAPIVKNELINRRYLSSAAATARRNLIKALIQSNDQQGLGLTGYPPERSIYESLLLQSGIHRQNEFGCWEIGRPQDTDKGMQEAWDYILKTTHSHQLQPKLVSELFHELSDSPYGVADGFVPILLCACLIANSPTMALYEDRTFVPLLSDPVMERLTHRPEKFSILSFGVDGERAAVIDRFARGFKVDNGILPVVRSLYARMGSLSKYAEGTQRLPARTTAVRDTILRGKSPERLLFQDLPTVLDCEPFQSSTESSVNSDNVETFFERLNEAFDSLVRCYPDLLERVRRGLTEIFQVGWDEDDWRKIVTERATRLYDTVTDQKLRILIVRARDSQLGPNEYLESVGAGIVGEPPSQWGSASEDSFMYLVPQLASQVRVAESMQHLANTLNENEQGYLVSINSKKGEEVRQVVRFTSKEEKDVKKLVQIFGKEKAFAANPRITLAAITEVARQLMKLKTEENGVDITEGKSKNNGK